MKMVVVTTITSTLDIDSRDSTHVVDIEDQDGLSEVGGDVLFTVVMAGLRATDKGIRQKAPRVGAATDSADAKEIARLRKTILDIGFCPEHGESMPCINGCGMG